MAFIDSQLARLILQEDLLPPRPALEGDQQEGASISDESRRYVSGYTTLTPFRATDEENSHSGQGHSHQDQEPAQPLLLPPPAASLSRNASDGRILQHFDSLRAEDLQREAALGRSLGSDDQKQFIGNIRQLRENRDQSQRMNKTRALLLKKRRPDDTIDEQYDSDDDSASLLAEYYKDQEAALMSEQAPLARSEGRSSRKRALGHILMLLLLIEIVLLQVKNYFLQAPKTYSGLSFTTVFGFPMTLATIVGADLLYEKYIAKLQRSHLAIYNRFLVLLVILTVTTISFFMAVSIYMSEPQTLGAWGLIALVPYYLGWCIVGSFFIYISPALLDPTNKIAQHQVLMGSIYLVFAFSYPLYLAIVVFEEKQNPLNDGVQMVFEASDAKLVNLPFVFLFSLHFLLLLPSLFKSTRKVEALAILGLVGCFLLEMLRYEDWEVAWGEKRAKIEHRWLALGAELWVWICCYVNWMFL